MKFTFFGEKKKNKINPASSSMKFESGSLGLKSLLKTSLVAHPWVDYFIF